jgi:hypothetical protein
VRARREEDQEEEDYIFKPAESLQFQNGAGKSASLWDWDEDVEFVGMSFVSFGQ